MIITVLFHFWMVFHYWSSDRMYRYIPTKYRHNNIHFLNKIILERDGHHCYCLFWTKIAVTQRIDIFYDS